MRQAGSVHYGIVEGEPGSLPWGQWRLMMWLRDRLGHRTKKEPDAEQPKEQAEEHAEKPSEPER